MRDSTRPASWLPVLALALVLGACRTATVTAPMVEPSPVAPTASDAETPDAEKPVLPNDVKWARTAAEHKAILIQTYRFAGEVLAAMAAELEPGTWAVALDADETVIDNSLYQKERTDIGESYTSESWAAWVARREAPPLPGVLGFLDRVHALGGWIAIVTNRKQEHCGDTEANFRAFSVPFDVILCRGDDERKEARWQQVEDGTASPEQPPLAIVMWLGDNIQDFPHLDQSLREKPEVAFERFGVDFFVLPNPMYGSWQDNPDG